MKLKIIHNESMNDKEKQKPRKKKKEKARKILRIKERIRNKKT